MTNKVDDALSRQGENKLEETCVIHTLGNTDKWIMARLLIEVQTNTNISTLRDTIIRDEELALWEATDGLIFCKGLAYMNAD